MSFDLHNSKGYYSLTLRFCPPSLPLKFSTEPSEPYIKPSVPHHLSSVLSLVRPKCEESLIILACIRWNILPIWPLLFSFFLVSFFFFFSKQYLKVNVKRFDAKAFGQIKMKLEDEFSVACSCCEIFLFWLKFYYLRTSVYSLCNTVLQSGLHERAASREKSSWCEMPLLSLTEAKFLVSVLSAELDTQRKKSTKSMHKASCALLFQIWLLVEVEEKKGWRIT